MEYGYQAQNLDELSIKKGDKIRNVIRKEDGWFEGELVHTGQRGVFPDNFVKPIKSSPKTTVFNEERKKIVSPKPTLLTAAQFQAKVLYSYVPVNEDELSIQENDVVTVLRLVEDGWFEGILNGKRGVFPSNYVQKLDEPVHASPSTIVVADDANKKKKVFGIGFGNIFSGKQIELKTKETFGSAQIDTGKSKIKAKVLFDYEPVQADELRLVRNELVYILDRNLEDEGWWRGESIATGKIGVFPDNFVQIIADDEKTKMDGLNSTGSSSAASSSNNSLQREIKSDELGVIVVDSDNKLTHMKKTRPIHRRPPSFRAKRGENELADETKSVSPASTIASSVLVAKSPVVQDADLSAMRQEIESLKQSALDAQTESKQVKMELIEIKKINEEQTKKMTKKMNELILEIDEEKKTRLALQVELERLKKIIWHNS